jgi:hypothetical protein
VSLKLDNIGVEGTVACYSSSVTVTVTL